MPVPTRAISEDRLKSWLDKLAQFNATPVVIIGVGHDHRSGELHVVTCENIEDAELRKILWAAFKKTP